MSQVMQIFGRYYWLTVIAYSGMNIAVMAIVLCTGWSAQSTVGVVLGLAFCGFFLNTAATASLVALSTY